MNDLRNGLDINQLLDLISAMKAEPGKAKVNFSATTKWIEGAHSQTKVRDFVLEADEPKELAGTDKYANPVEIILAGLGACLATGFAYNAAIRGINMESLEISLDGNLDLRGFLGISDGARSGYQTINVHCKMKSDVSREKVQELFEHVVKTSPVGDIVRNGVPVTIDIED